MSTGSLTPEFQLQQFPHLVALGYGLVWNIHCGTDDAVEATEANRLLEKLIQVGLFFMVSLWGNLRTLRAKKRICVKNGRKGPNDLMAWYTSPPNASTKVFHQFCVQDCFTWDAHVYIFYDILRTYIICIYIYSFTLKVSIYMGYMYSYEGSVHDMIDAINTFV